MRPILLATVFLIAGLMTGDGLADDSVIVRVADGDSAYRQRLGQHFGHLPRDRKHGEFVLVVDSDDWRWLQANGYDARFDVVLSAQLRSELVRTIPGFSCYNTVEETDAFIDAQVLAYPGLAATIDIGDSWEKISPTGVGGDLPGYDLRLLKITNSAIIADKPRMFVMTGLHAREYAPVQLNLKFAEWLLTNYGTDAEATWLVDHNEFHLLLQANPDGRKIAEGGLSQRKNRHYFNTCAGTDVGVDLNRNFPFYWNMVAGGSSGAMCDETYRGPFAGSEPETIAIDAYVTALFPDTRAGDENSLTEPAADTTRGQFFDIHSWGGLVLYPWGVTVAASGNNAAFRASGRRLAWFNSYYPEAAAALYATDGSSLDNSYGKRGVPAISFELGNMYFESCAEFENSILPNNLNALRYAARVLERPYRLPAGPDAYAATATPTTVMIGAPVVITLTASDARFSQVNGSEPIQNIASAIVTVDRLPWDPLAVSQPVFASDGNFDSATESLTATLATAGLAPGRHIAFVQATDASAAAGAPAAVFFMVEDALFVDGFEGPR